jgi:putative membrane protein
VLPGDGLDAGGDEDNKGCNDQKFVTQASAAGLAEVNLSREAMQHATAANMKKFAQHMVEDHTKANMELNQLADKKGLRVAMSMDQKHQELADELARLTGAEFDRGYSDAMLMDHKEAVTLFSDEAKNGQDADVKAWAGKTLPTLKEHLKMAEELTGTKGDKGTEGKDR